MKMLTPKIIRQGDVLLVPVQSIPGGCKEVPLEAGRIVLMHGEVTGHAHAIADHTFDSVRERPSMARSADAAKRAIADAARRTKAVLLRAENGTRYLHVMSSVTLKHEEHTEHVIPPGCYELPTQMEHDVSRGLRRVAD